MAVGTGVVAFAAMADTAAARIAHAQRSVWAPSWAYGRGASGLEPACPYVQGALPAREAGSLAGTVLVVFVSVALLSATLVACRGRIPRAAAALYFVVYAAYVAYEVLATAKLIPPLCLGSTCI